MSGTKAAAAAVPGALHAYIVGVALVGAATLVACAYALAVAWPVEPLALAGALVAGAALVLFHRRPFTLYWREHRLIVSLDETIILVALLVCPPALVVFAVTAGVTVMQLWGGPSAGIKRLFNCAQYVVAGLITAGAYIGLGFAGLPPVWAAAVASLAFGVAANALLAGVFGILSNVSALRVFRERFLVQGTAAAVVGVSGGLMIVALWQLHPAAVLASLPFVYLVRRFFLLHAVADRELEVHRHLADAMHDLVGTSEVPAVAERVLAECERLLDCGRARIVIDAGEDKVVDLTRDYGSGPQRGVPPFVAPLPAHDKTVLGAVEVWPRQGKEPFGPQEHQLLRTIAGQASSAIQNARAIAEAKGATRRLDTYLSTAQDAVLLVGTNGEVQYANPAARRLFATGDDAIGCRASDLFEDPRLALLGQATPEEPILVEANARTRAGDRRFLVEAHVGPVTHDGRVTGALMVARDVTERKRLEDEMRRQREALAQNEKLSALGTLVAGVAHEINNPLTYMRGNLQICTELLAMRMEEKDLTDADRQLLADLNESVRVALEGVERITGIASSLKNVARKGTGHARPENLNRLVEEVLSVVRAGMPRSVRLELDLAPELPEVRVQASEIHQILLNLIKNAAEALHGRTDGLVRVRSWATDDAVHLEVADNGCGIPAEVQRSLFAPFFTTKENGTGLGLSISRGIARAHGGDLEVASQPGEGTTFVLSLPLRAEEPAAEPGVEAAP